MYIGIRKPMLKYYLEQILGYQKEILTESQGAADKLQQGHETPPLFLLEQHVDVGSTKQYFTVNLPLSGGGETV